MMINKQNYIKLVAKRIMVEYTSRSDHPWSTIFCAIVYSLESNSKNNPDRGPICLPKIKILRNLSCLETRFRLLAVDNSLHSSLNLTFKQYKLHNIFIIRMAYKSIPKHYQYSSETMTSMDTMIFFFWLKISIKYLENVWGHKRSCFESL